jgi:leader peptidase (prepilin peptidase) / N-methyltransferase
VNQLLSIDFFAVFTFLVGLVFGSFLNVIIYRVPRGTSIVRPGSACPNCGAGIRAYDNVPVVSWIVLRGRCRNCHQAITARYAIVELITGFLFVAAYYFAAPLDSSLGRWLVIKLCVFFFLLLGLIFIDFEHHLLPDALTLPGLAVGLLSTAVVPVGGMPLFVTRRLLALHWNLAAISLLDAACGAAIGASFIYAVGEIYFRARGVEGMGFGDVKLMGMVGAFLGPKLTLFTIFMGAIVGTIFGVTAMLAVWRKRLARRQRKGGANAALRSWQSARLMLRYYEVPFGVFLGSMAILSTFVGNQLVNSYLNLYR